MARYYFHVRDYFGSVVDEEGQELADLTVARREALRSARAIMAEDVRQGFLDLKGTVEVADLHGRILLTLSFGDAVEIRPGDPSSTATSQIREAS
jgi:hypothetical protein